MVRVITLGDGTQVRLSDYLRAVKMAKANPDTQFDRGLTCWWPCKGKEIMRQFLEGVQDRINQRGAGARVGV